VAFINTACAIETQEGGFSPGGDVEAYRDEVLSAAEIGRLLGHSSRWETEAFLQEKQASLHYTEEDLARDIETLRNVTRP